MINRISLGPKDVKNLYLSLEASNPSINVTVTEGTVNLSLSKALFADSAEKRIIAVLKAGDSVVVRAPGIRVRNTGTTLAKCEFSALSGQ